MNPGVIDTELFHLPDNDEGFHSAVEALPVEAIVEPVLDELESGTIEIYVPDWFDDIVAGKFADTQRVHRGHQGRTRELDLTNVRSRAVRAGPPVSVEQVGLLAGDLVVERLEAEVARDVRADLRRGERGHRRRRSGPACPPPRPGAAPDTCAPW